MNDGTKQGLKYVLAFTLGAGIMAPSASADLATTTAPESVPSTVTLPAELSATYAPTTTVVADDIDPIHGGPSNGTGGYWCPSPTPELDYSDGIWTNASNGAPFAESPYEDAQPSVFYCDPVKATQDYFGESEY